MEHQRQPPHKAAAQPAEKRGMPMPERREAERPTEQQQRALIATLTHAAEHYQRQLREHPQAQKARDYLQGRGVDQDSMERYGIGFAPAAPTLVKALSQIADEERLIEAGLLAKSERGGDERYERFRDRIMFPIRNRSGQVIAFGGRAMDPKARAKYLNSPETPVFHKRKMLYGLHEARQRKLSQLLIVEGYMDAIALDQHGEHGAVASLGTALSEEQLELAFSEVPRVVICFDGDNAGRMAAVRLLEPALRAMRDGRHIAFLSLPQGSDPDSYVREHGTAEFDARIAESAVLSEFLFQSLADGLALDTAEGRAQYAERALPLLTQTRPGVYAESLRKQLAERCGVAVDTLAIPSARPQPDAPAGDGYIPDDGYASDDGYIPDDGYVPDDGYASGDGYASPAALDEESHWAETALSLVLATPELTHTGDLEPPSCAADRPSGLLLRQAWQQLVQTPSKELAELPPEQTMAQVQSLAQDDTNARILQRAGRLGRWADIGKPAKLLDLRACFEYMKHARQAEEHRQKHLDAMPGQSEAEQKESLLALVERRKQEPADARPTLHPERLITANYPEQHHPASSTPPSNP